VNKPLKTPPPYAIASVDPAPRFALAAPETARGLGRMVLDAAPLPGLPETPATEAIEPPRTKKAVLLARLSPSHCSRSPHGAGEGVSSARGLFRSW
jgi:hypothetical protein